MFVVRRGKMTSNASTFRQFYAIICANLMTFIYGIAVAWPSPMLPRLQSSKDSPLPSGPITLDEATWVGSILYIAGTLGTPFFGFIAAQLGHKRAVSLIVAPTAISWVLILIAGNIRYLYAARFLAGFGGAGTFAVVQLMVAEVAEDRLRGILGSLLMFFYNGGVLTGYTMCSYLDYMVPPAFCLGICSAFLIGFWFVPETPRRLLSTGQKEEAEKSFMFYRGYISHPEIPIQTSKNGSLDGQKIHCDDSSDDKLTLADFTTRSTCKGILIGSCLMFLALFTGIFTLSNYYESIFAEAGSSLSPADSTIFVAAIQLLGNIFSTTLIEKAGRKLLLGVSSFGSAACLASIGTYSYLRVNDILAPSVLTWLPLTCLSLLVFLASNGAASLPFVVIGEIYAPKVRGTLVTGCLVLSWLITFASVKVFPFLVIYVGLHGALWSYALICSGFAILLLWLIPETKGQSIERIIEILERRK